MCMNRHGSHVQTCPHGAYFVCMYTGCMHTQARLIFKPVYTFVRMYINRHGSVTKKFIELMREYEATQGKYKALLKQRVARQVCCSLLQRAAVCCGNSAIMCFSVLRHKCVAACVLQGVAGCCSVLQCVAVEDTQGTCDALWKQRVARQVCCSVVVCCSRRFSKQIWCPFKTIGC